MMVLKVRKWVWGSTFALGWVAMMVVVPIQAKVTAGDVTGGIKAPHLNIAIFHKVHGQEAFQYPDTIAKSDILSSMLSKAQFISINHTAGLLDGDVVTIANDVLRDNAGAFDDFGVDCQIIVHVKEALVTLSGLCQMMVMDQDHRKVEHKGMIKPFAMKHGSDWQLIYYDAEDGIAVYADEEIGLD